MLGWLWEGRNEAAQRAAGWAGVMSLPRVLTSRSDGNLGVQPAPELQSLRGRHTHLENATVTSSSPTRVELQGATLEILAEFKASPASHFGLKVRCAPDGSEQTLIDYDPGSGWLSIDREHSSLDPSVQREPHGTRLELTDDQTLTLHVFVDCSVIEVYANTRACLTSRVYPSRPDSLQVAVFASGGTVNIQRLDAWEITSIWPKQRLTVSCAGAHA
jgi:beta-fructofuranosidase